MRNPGVNYVVGIRHCDPPFRDAYEQPARRTTAGISRGARTAVLLAVRVCLSAIFFAGLGLAGQPEQPRSKLQIEADNLKRRWNSEAARGAIRAYSAAAEAWLRAGNLDPAVECLINAADVHVWFAEYDRSEEILKRALGLSLAENEKAAVARAHAALTQIAVLKGDSRAAKTESSKALAAAQASGDDRALAEAFLAAGEFEFGYGTGLNAVRNYERAFEFATRNGAPSLIGNALLSLGYAKARRDDPLTALQTMRRALEIAVSNDDRRGTALANFGLGFVYLQLDENRNALNQFKNAESMLPEGLDDYRRGMNANSLATIYERYGDLELGESYRMQALRQFESANSKLGQIGTLISLATLRFATGKREEQKADLMRAERLAKETGDVFYLAIIDSEAAGFAISDGAYDLAIKRLKRAESSLRSMNLVPSKPLTGLGIAYEKKGDLKTAKKYFDAALAEDRRVRDNSHAAEVQFHRARIAKAGNDLDGALAAIRESIALSDSAYRGTSNLGLRQNFLATVYKRYELNIDLLMASERHDPQAPEKALLVAELSRARSLLETLRSSDIDPAAATDPATADRLHEIRGLMALKSETLSNLLAQNGAPEETESLDREIAVLRTEADDLRAKLRAVDHFAASVSDPAEFDLSAFRERFLKDGTLLVEFALGDETSFLWIVGADSFSAYRLPPKARIEAKVSELRGLLASGEPRPDDTAETFNARLAESERAYAAAASELGRMLFAGVREDLRNRRLIVIPDGKLHYFPVGALPVDAGDDAPLLFHSEIVYQPSAQILAAIADRNATRKRSAGGLLVFADPVFGADDPRVGETRPHFTEGARDLARLTASEAEARSIGESFSSGATRSLAGFAANRGALIGTDLSMFRILHFSTHAIVDENRPELSGIALSGVDETGAPSDPMVRLQDIYSLRLDADLVVLSACSTGIGKEFRGEGLVSLNNAFLSAGSRSVVASLWKVEDSATKDLMADFYASIAAGARPSEALRRAQLRMRGKPKYRSPQFWAAFTFQGDFESVPEVSTRSTRRLLIGTGIAAALIALIAVSVRRSRRFRRFNAPQL